MNLKWSPSERSNYVDFEHNVVVIHSALSKSKQSRFIPMSYSLQCELFDLKKDPMEMNNLYGNDKYKERVVELKAELEALQQQYDVKESDY